jgi:hypothetical protein
MRHTGQLAPIKRPKTKAIVAPGAMASRYSIASTGIDIEEAGIALAPYTSRDANAPCRNATKSLS